MGIKQRSTRRRTTRRTGGDVPGRYTRREGPDSDDEDDSDDEGENIVIGDGTVAKRNWLTGRPTFSKEDENVLRKGRQRDYEKEARARFREGRRLGGGKSRRRGTKKPKRKTSNKAKKATKTRKARKARK
jgi:hypothetical protein